MDNMPIITLSNNIRIANFSSFHSFLFVDGKILPGCSAERTVALSLDVLECEVIGETEIGIPYTNIYMEWSMSDAIYRELYRVSDIKDYDILLIPLPVMEVIKKGNFPGSESVKDLTRARCVRVADRVSKAIHIDRFCI